MKRRSGVAWFVIGFYWLVFAWLIWWTRDWFVSFFWETVNIIFN